MNGWRFPRWVAHRGAGRLAPENTLAAFRLGASLGWRAFECDVKLSADGVPWLLHDATLERTTSGAGPADALPWSALSRLDAGGWHGRNWAGEPPPSLEAVVRFVQRNGFALNLEIKPVPGAEDATGAAVAAACARAWPDPAARERAPLLLSSFQPAALAAARREAPQLARALLLEKLHDGWLHAAQDLQCAAVVTNFRLMDAALLARLRGAQLRALCYTVNDAADAARLLALPEGGVDGLITDAVERFAPSLPDGGG